MDQARATGFPPAARFAGGIAAWILGLLLALSLRSVAEHPPFAVLQAITAASALVTAGAFLRQLAWAPRAANFFVFLMLTGALVSFVVFERPLDLLSASLLAVVAFSGGAIARQRKRAADPA